MTVSTEIATTCYNNCYNSKIHQNEILVDFGVVTTPKSTKTDLQITTVYSDLQITTVLVDFGVVTTPKSTKTRNPDFSVPRGTNSN